MRGWWPQGRVSSSLTLGTTKFCLPGAIGRRAGFKNRMFRVRVSGKAPGFSPDHFLRSSVRFADQIITARLAQLVDALALGARCSVFESQSGHHLLHSKLSACGGIGRRRRLKICWEKFRMGSSPFLPTTLLLAPWSATRFSSPECESSNLSGEAFGRRAHRPGWHFADRAPPN